MPDQPLGRDGTRRRARSLRPAALVVAGLLVAACGGGPSPQPDSTPGTRPSHPGPPAPGPAQQFLSDASLTIGLRGEPSDWNPLAAAGAGDPALAAVAEAVLPSAFLTTAAGTANRDSELIAAVSETAATAQQPQTVVYDINPRAVWSDGVAITGADFAYTWEAQSGRSRFRDVGGRRFTPASTAAYRPVASVTAPATDPDRVVVRFSTPDANWEALFDPILPAHVARAVGFDRGFRDPVTSLVSGGPFVVQSYQPGDDVVLVRNPRWWGAAPNLSTLDIRFVDSTAEATTGLLQGQLDAATTAFTSVGVAELRADSGLAVSVTDTAAFDDLVFDERSGPLAERAVRLAVMLAVDRRSLGAAAVASGDTAASPVRNRAFPPGSTAYRDDSGTLGQATIPKPAGARQLLAAAGFSWRGATLIRRGMPVGFTLAVETSSPLAGAEAAAVIAACRTLGIAVTTTVPSAAEGPSPTGANRSSMFLLQAPRSASPSVLAGTYGTVGRQNRSGYSSTVMDGLLARLASAGSTAEADDVADQVDAQAWGDAVDLPLLGVPEVLAVQSRYLDLTAAPTVAGVGDDPGRWGIAEST